MPSIELPPPLRIRVPSGRVAHIIDPCPRCEGTGWLFGKRGGPFGLALVELRPCGTCPSRFSETDGGLGWTLRCGAWLTEIAIERFGEAAPDDMRTCAGCLQNVPRGVET